MYERIFPLRLKIKLKILPFGIFISYVLSDKRGTKKERKKLGLSMTHREIDKIIQVTPRRHHT